MKSKKGVVLPTVVVSMIILTIFSVLLLIFNSTSKLTNQLIINKSMTKLKYEKIFYNYVNSTGKSLDDGYELLEYDSYSDSTYETKNDSIKSIILKKNNEMCFYAIYYSSNNKLIAFQYGDNFCIELDENNNFSYNGNYFKINT